MRVCVGGGGGSIFLVRYVVLLVQRFRARFKPFKLSTRSEILSELRPFRRCPFRARFNRDVVALARRLSNGVLRNTWTSAFSQSGLARNGQN